MVYDPLSKKLISSNGIVFMEVKTTKDINKVEKSTMLEKDNIVCGVDPVRLPNSNPKTINGNVNNGEPHDYVGDQQFGDE